MELKVTSKKEEPLLSRTMVEAELVFEKATPSNEEIRSKLAQSLGKDEKLVVIKNAHTSYGLKKAKITSYVYDDEKLKEKIERKIKKDKKAKDGEEAKAAENKK